jgi:hypothetical protein
MNAGIFANPDGRGGTTLATAELFSAGFYAKDRIVLSPISYQFYIKKVAGTTTADPSADITNWARIGAAKRRSYQEFEIAFAATETVKTATVSALQGEYVLHHLGTRITTAASPDDPYVTLEYTNPTTITARRAGLSTSAVAVRGAVEDFW